MGHRSCAQKLEFGPDVGPVCETLMQLAISGILPGLGKEVSWMCFVDLGDILYNKANPSNIIGSGLFISISQTPMAITEKERWMKTMAQRIHKDG